MVLLNTAAAVRRQVPMLWIAGLMIALALINNLPRLYDEHLRGPWIDPVVEILPQPVGKPLIRYGARASIDARGVWTTWIETGGVRCCTTKGQGNYVAGREPREWDWAAWFGHDWPVPPRPFAACVAYDLTANSGARRQFGPFCSAEFDPRGAP